VRNLIVPLTPDAAMPLAQFADPWQKVQIKPDSENPHTDEMLVDEVESDHDYSNGVDREIELTEVTREGYEKAEASNFELLKVLGQGSFGKRIYLYQVKSCHAIRDDS